MKKIYLSILAVAALSTVGTAQKNYSDQLGGNEKASRVYESYEVTANKTAANVPVGDTLNYFFNKHYFRNAPPNDLSFPTIKNAPTYTAANSAARLGSMFENSGMVVVFGAEGTTLRQASSPSATVPVAFSLYNVVAGIPSGAALASFTTGVASSTIGVTIGGNFTTPVIVNGPYAIIMENASVDPADTIRIFLTNAKTATASANNNEKFGESFGMVGTQGNNWFNLTNAFGAGTDYEGVVAARVGYTITADHASTTMTTCNTVPVNYPNTSSSWINHRQYNLNKFLVQWAPFGNTAAYTAFTPIDSVFTWNFGDGTTEYVFSPNHTYNVSSSGPVNDDLIAKLQVMSGSGFDYLDSKQWSINVTICNVGLTENSIENKFAVYPNPATDNVTVYVNNANANTQIQVLNALGQVVLTKTNVSDRNDLNTASFAKGVYFVKVSNGKETSTSKLIINN